MTRHSTRISVFLIIVLVAGAGAGSGTDLLTKDSFFEMENVRDAAISPDGEHIVFTRRWVDLKVDRYRSNLWITDRNGDRPRELTSGGWKDSSPVWSPDGKRLAFLSDRDGTTQLHVLYLDERDVGQLTRLETSPSQVSWSPDGARLAFTLFVPDKSSALEIKLPPAPKGAKRAEGPKVVDRTSWARDGSGFQPQGFRHIFTVDAKLGGTPKQVTSGDYNHSGPAWSADSKQLIFSGIRKEDAEYLRGDSELYRLDLATKEVSALTTRKGPDRSPRVSPDGHFVAYSGYDDQEFTSHLSSLYLLDLRTGSSEPLATKLPNSPGSVHWSNDSSGVYFTIGQRGSTQIWFAPKSGKAKALTDGVQTMASFTLAKNGRAAAIRSDFHTPGTLTTFDISSPESAQEIVDLNQDVLDNVQLGDVEELNFASSDGTPIQGWLIKPADLEEGEKAPMLLWIHGGPWSMYSVGFNWAWQHFVAKGYAVLYLNPRGSTGYGQDFVNGIQYSYPGKDYDDLMAGVDAALAKGFIDERNLFVCGGSGGGVLTAWIVGHTDRFRAAVSMRPVINWHSFVGNTDGISWYDQFRKFPWEDPAEYHQRSPLSYVANVTTPTMVMTGEADLRTPMSQSEEYYKALKVLRKDTLLIRVPEEYHGWRRPSNRLRQQLYLQAWFEKWATDDAWPESGSEETP